VRVSLVVAVAENRVIGRDGELPWHLPDDLRHFKRVTLGHPVIMGRKTFESILGSLGRPLPKRRNLVVTRDPEYRHEGPGARRVKVVHSLEEAFEAAGEEADEEEVEEEVFVVGGAEIFARALPRAHRLHLTVVHAEPEGDVHLPELDLESWRLVEEEHHPADAHHAHPFTFRLYDRR